MAGCEPILPLKDRPGNIAIVTGSIARPVKAGALVDAAGITAGPYFAPSPRGCRRSRATGIPGPNGPADRRAGIVMS
jgi:hypothetical protein